MSSEQAIAALHWQHELLSSLEVGIVVLDKNFKIEVWNQFMENHSNKLPRSVIGQSLFSQFPEIDEGWLRAKAEPVFSLRSPTFIVWEQRPYLFKFASNRPITSASDTMYQNVTLFPLTNTHGDIDRICLLVYDVTDQALAKIRVENLNKRLEVMSRIDGLTGLYNRRYWQERFDKEYKLARRRERSVTVVMLDIDHFKKVNDTYGHQAGDKVIQSLADVVKKSIRETDLAGRYGGEEFVIVLSDSNAEGAYLVAERIREVAKQQRVEHDGNHISYTVSIGLSEHSIACPSAMAWLEMADQALYKAKESGRDQTVVANI
ncbi:sensor domain-containing diguanylate cyclase [Alteromonas sediminis]|uniref:diguanylate cyclase n=1 Tax=Alteromonas sediminis TaxID=2259342 RepID=A0A3N5XYG0_9ALTE|nr:sensor domain-containing diguanylate cyclase [Alteromonas sediminis]RPJ66032.1 sensor domain-containing diguanylate cyclase [Alteromonas sediminis]